MVGLLVAAEHSESFVSTRRTQPQLGEHCCAHALLLLLLVFSGSNVADVAGAAKAAALDVEAKTLPDNRECASGGWLQ